MNGLQVMGFDRQQFGIKVAVAGLSFIELLLCIARWMEAESSPPLPNAVVSILVGAACWLAAWQGSVLAHSWFVAARVLRGRQVPTGLWLQWMRDSLTSSGLVWAVLVVGTAILMALGNSPWYGLRAIALLAFVVSLSLLASLASRGLASRWWIWVFPLSMGIAMFSSTVGGGFSSALRFWGSAPVWLLAVMGAALPALLGWLHARWASGPPESAEAPLGVTLPATVKRIQAWAARYTFLSHRPMQPESRTGLRRGAVWQVMLIPVIFVANGPIFAQPWGGAVTALQIWVTGLYALFASTSLVCKDAHWRTLLAPGGLTGGRLGWQIAVSTASAYALGFALLAMVGLVAASLSSEQALQGLLDYALQLVALPFQLVFAISVATVIRGTLSPWRWYAFLLVVWLLVGAGIYIAVGSSARLMANVPVTRVDFQYISSYLVLSALLLWASNKLWTVERLLHTMPRSV